jgi:uncharacterized protein with beta-barrel porin domain
MAALQKFPFAAVATVAVASLAGIGGFAPTAHAACTPDGTTLNCTGNITGDLFFGGFQDTSGSYTTYNFFDITDPVPIQPIGTGIFIRSPDDATDLVVTTDAAVLTTGGNAVSLEALDGFITLENTGDLTSSNAGIYVFSKANTTPGVAGALVTNHGDIAADASGVWARTLGGGDVTVINTGNITATGSNAIVVQTTGNGFVTNSGDLSGASAVFARGVGTNDVTLQSGIANGTTYGVRFESGTTNTLNNSATLSGGILAVYGFGGDETVNNDGTINGSVNLGAGTNAFNNLAGGIFRPTHSVTLGAGNTFSNAGTLSPGGTGTAVVTTVTGDFEQTGTGTFAVDVDEGAGTEADRINVSGTASFAGTILPNVIALTSETGQLTIATATALTSTATVTNGGGYDFSLLVQGGNMLLLSWISAPPADIVGLLTNANANQRAIAIYLDTLSAAGPTAAQQALIDALLALGETELISAINQLTPELYSDAQISTLYSSLGFANSLLSCKVNGTTTASIIAEGQCLWAGASANFLKTDSTSQQIGYRENVGLFSAGAQFALDEAWRFGFGASYQQSWLETATNATSDGDAAQAGIALKYNSGPFLAAATLSGGRGWYDTMRPVSFTGFSGTASSQSTIDVVNGGLRLAYVLGAPQIYFKPVLDAAATLLDMSGFSESGGGAANLAVQGTQQTVYTIAPSLEVGTEWWWANGTLVRPFVRGGATFYSGNDFALSASFVGAPVGVTPFQINTDSDDAMATAGVGIDVISANETVLHFAYDGEFGETTQVHAVGLKGSARF